MLTLKAKNKQKENKMEYTTPTVKETSVLEDINNMITDLHDEVKELRPYKESLEDIRDRLLEIVTKPQNVPVQED